MKGLIAFLDILGYQSFLENNSATESALKVLEMVTTLPKDTHTQVAQEWSANKLDKSITDSLQHVIFSDTIVLLIPFEKDEKKAVQAVTYMVTLAGVLAAKMFDAGLPIRGAIHQGEFIVKDSCFAGTGIVEAYRLCSRLDFSGLVLGEEIMARFAENQTSKQPFLSKPLYDRLFVPILSPLKSSKNGESEERRLTHMNWLTFTGGALREHLESDLIQCVMTRFWAHGKDCPAAVDGKIRNTCKIMRRLRMELPPPKQASAETK
jgi:hypothetical protein